MSYYGRGGVSADFPGMARARRQEDDPSVFQIFIAQRLGPDSFVVVAGYGEGGVGCVPTDKAWKEGYDSR